MKYNNDMDESGWKARFASEIERGLAARAANLEGKARVCARRAAGVVIGEYLDRHRLPQPGPSAYSRLQILHDLPGISSEIRNLCEHFLMHVGEDFTLPAPIDLLAEAHRLALALGLDPENSFV